MFDIEYKGGNGVVITTKKTQVVVDPNLSVVGLKNLSVKEAVELATEARFVVNDESAKLIIEGPGEYETADVSVRGITATRHLDTSADEPISTIYRIEIGELRLAVVGNIAPKLSEDQLEDIGIIDILVLPVGGNGYTLDGTSAATIVRSVDPRAIIPVHYADSAVKYEVPQDNLDIFIKEMAAPVEEAGAKYKVKSSASVPQVLTVIKIDRS
jgi:L-ascorbate metabolism protein UlaG (beta-lactamase superfamily)